MSEFSGGDLAGKRVLVVEDEALVAALLEDMLIDLGAAVVGIASTIDAGLVMAEREDIDLAVLDMNVRGRRIDPVAARLYERGVPIVFATGYGEGAPTAMAPGAPTLSKPFTHRDLAATLARTLRGRTPAPLSGTGQAAE